MSKKQEHFTLKILLNQQIVPVRRQIYWKKR